MWGNSPTSTVGPYRRPRDSVGKLVVERGGVNDGRGQSYSLIGARLASPRATQASRPPVTLSAPAAFPGMPPFAHPSLATRDDYRNGPDRERSTRWRR